MACYTQEEISEKVGIARQTITDKLALMPDLDKCLKAAKVSSLYQDAEWKPSPMPFILRIVMVLVCFNAANCLF